MSSALQLKSPELAKLIEQADEPLLRRVAVKSAAKALYITHAEAPLIQKAIEAAEADDYGNAELIRQLRDLADEVERPYTKVLDAARPVEGNEKLMTVFRQARAITALYLALSEDIKAQAGNAVYEALYADLSIEDVKRFLQD